MKGLDLDSLEKISEQFNLPFEDVRKVFEELEAEGRVFQAKDEVSGKTLWFPIQELDTEAYTPC
jgi:hypothetical protein